MNVPKIARVYFAGVLAVMPSAIHAQIKNGPAPSVTGANSGAAGAASAELMASTVHEAWLKSGRNEDKFFDMVKQLAEISASKRGLTLPDTEEAGRKMGMLIKTGARRDPDQSLYAVVDAAVKATAKAPATAR